MGGGFGMGGGYDGGYGRSSLGKSLWMVDGGGAFFEVAPLIVNAHRLIASRFFKNKPDMLKSSNDLVSKYLFKLCTDKLAVQSQVFTSVSGRGLRSPGTVWRRRSVGARVGGPTQCQRSNQAVPRGQPRLLGRFQV